MKGYYLIHSRGSMGSISPYLNQEWPDAVWDVSGAFVYDRELVAFYDFCKLFLGFEPFRIVHGAPLCVWNSGRVLPHLMRTTAEMRAAGLAYEKRGIALYYTFSNHLLEEKHLTDVLGNALLTFATRHNPGRRNAVILSSDLLDGHVRAHYPELRRVSSILKVTTMGGRGKLDVYRRLADQYDEVMVHPDDVLRDELLEKLEDKERYILLINEYCIRNCPLRPLHYKALSETSLDFLHYDSTPFINKQKENGCLDLRTMLTHPEHSVLALTMAEIARLRAMGFRHFKLQGRGQASAAPLLSDLLRLVCRQDAADENAMHSIGQRFWESLLPPAA